MKTPKFYNIILFFCYLIAFALSIKSFREPDLWWQIRTGEWILENKSVPLQDVFSYTMAGTEWINVKWGFEVLAAIITSLTGPESVFILQALISLIMVFFLIRLVKGFTVTPEFNIHAFAAALIITLLGIEYRMIGRPEMFSHLFTLIFLFYLVTFRKSPSKKIFLLIPFQLLWANMHEAFGIGIILISIFAFGAWFEYFTDKESKKPEKKKSALTLSLIIPAVLASVCINPNGIKLLLRPLNILSQVYENKFTKELHSFTTSAYWEKEAFVGLIVLVVSIFGLITLLRDKKKLNLSRRIEKIGMGYVLTWIAFLYLALTAYRNIIFFILVSFPVLYFLLNSLLIRLEEKKNRILKYLKGSIVFILVAFYILVVSNKYYELTDSRNRFGLEVLAVSNPVDAADYIEQNNLKDKKCFSDYLISSCLLWKLQPEFKTYIDLRDFDVFPKEFFDQFIINVNYPSEFHKLDLVQNFEYVVLYRPQFKELHSYLYNDSVYACVYVDPVAAVYRKTDDFSRSDIFSECKPVKTSVFSGIVNHILNPFYKRYGIRDFDFDYAAAGYFMDVNQFELARKRAEKIILSGKEKSKGHEMLGSIYFEQAMRVRDSSITNELLMQAGNNFSEAIRLDKRNANSYTGLGNILLMRKNYRSALEKFEKCIEIDSDNYNARVMAGECYKMLLKMNNRNAGEMYSKILANFKAAEKINPGNPYIIFNIGMAYFNLKNCDKAVKYLLKIQDDPNLSLENRKVAKACVQQCEIRE